MAYFYRLILFLLFSVSSSISSAYVLTIDPAANLYPLIYQNCKGNVDYGDIKSVLLGSGRFWVAYRQGMNGNCMEANGFSCPIGTDTIVVDRYGAQCRTNNVCPENSSKQGGYCVCDSGYTEDGNSCVVKPPDACDGLAAYCGSLIGKEGPWQVSGSSRPASVCDKPVRPVVGASGGFTDAFPGCDKGCSLTTVRGAAVYTDGLTGDSVIAGSGIYSTESCSLSPDPEKPEPEKPEPKPNENRDTPCGPGTFPGTVGEVRVCLPAEKKTAEGPSTEVDNGDGTRTETSSTTTCSQGSCVTTTTTNIINNNTGQVNQTVSKTTESEGEFCSKNPSHGLCKTSPSKDNNDQDDDDEDGGSFSGSCSSGYVCEGDAIQCAIAKNQHELACSFTADTSSAEYGAYQQAKGAEGVQRGEDSSVSIADAISTDSLIGAGSCLSDLPVDFMGGTFDIPLSSLCPYFEMLGYLLVAVGMVMAIRIIGGA